MSCPCPMCNGRDIQKLGFAGGYSREEEEPEQEATSIYDRLDKVVSELKSYGAPQSVINELNDIAEKVDSIDDKVTNLAKFRGAVDWSYMKKLNEISKELF